MPVIGAGMPVRAPVAASVACVGRTMVPPAVAVGIACTAGIVTRPGIVRTAAAEVTSARGVTAAATPTVTATATAAMLREGGRGADQYRRQNAGCQKNALGPSTHDSHLRLPVAPLHGHLERIK